MLCDPCTVGYPVSVRPTFVTLGLFGLVLLLRTSVAIGDDSPEMRTWTSTAGTPARAALLDVEGRQARLKLADGTEKLVLIDQLSAEDQEYIGQWLDRRANKPPQTWKRFRNRSTGHEFDGKILERVNVRGQRKLFVKDTTGLTAWLWEAMFEISDVPDGTSNVPPGAPPPQPPTEASGTDEMTIDEMTIKPKMVEPLAQNVFVTGVGATLDEARKNAFSAAIERVVGVLVDAETLVKNDEVVREQVLTFSRGYINKYQEIGSREEGGLQYVTIAANVSVTKLGEKLRQSANIATLEIDGSVLKSFIEINRENEQIAREMFRKATIDFTPKNLLKVTLLDTKQKDAGAKVELTVAYRLDADPDAWKSIHTKLKPLLEAIATKHSAYTSSTKVNRITGGAYGVHWESSQPLGAGENSALLALFKDCTPEGTTAYWDTYLVPDSFQHEVSSLTDRGKRYRVSLRLVDSADHVIASVKERLYAQTSIGGGLSSVGPLLYHSYSFQRTRSGAVTFSLDTGQLGQVARCVAAIELASAE